MSERPTVLLAVGMAIGWVFGVSSFWLGTRQSTATGAAGPRAGRPSTEPPMRDEGDGNQPKGPTERASQPAYDHPAYDFLFVHAPRVNWRTSTLWCECGWKSTSADRGRDDGDRFSYHLLEQIPVTPFPFDQQYAHMGGSDR